ncbi:MAG: hypothetical protein U9O94_03755 [Nanoarchaeota archaeon]|nr:hypothetical protein [Nanoarchaeota archaeon]
MKFRNLGKKADIRTLAPTELIGYILAAVVIILILVVAGIFTTLYFSEKNEEFAINNMVALSNKIDTLSRDDTDFSAQRAFPFYLPPDFVVVGFNKEWDDKKESDGCGSEQVRKPNFMDGAEGRKCEDSACICIFGDNNDDFMDGDEYNVELIKCIALSEVDYITTAYLDDNSNYNYPSEIWKNVVGQKIGLPDYSNVAPNFEYSFFYIYGQCDNHFWDKDLKSRKLYIEKFKDEDKTYIFIAPEHEGIITQERYNTMYKKYG